MLTPEVMKNAMFAAAAILCTRSHSYGGRTRVYTNKRISDVCTHGNKETSDSVATLAVDRDFITRLHRLVQPIKEAAV